MSSGHACLALTTEAGQPYGLSMTGLEHSLVELIRRTSAEIPDDVQAAIIASLEREKKGTIAESAMLNEGQ